jgi:hypothetical protein
MAISAGMPFAPVGIVRGRINVLDPGDVVAAENNP